MDKQTQILRLVQELEDELDQFPLSSVIRSHAELTKQALDAWSDRLREIGHPGRKFWDHPAELIYDEAGVLLGAMFVLIQAAITETVSIVKRIYELNGQKINKNVVMSLEADLDSRSSLSYVAIANGAANYYKHRFEWPKDWHGASGQSQDTITLIRTLGMSPEQDLADNLLSAVHAIMNSTDSNLADLAGLVVEQWRSRLALQLRGQFQLA
ncbi:hypothetical protein [Pseudomonas putida]|uniref:hypothetical protein n=1 Tax=Pseudomonas putida TaxID=303 RepID=UPI00034F2067|nr:hypothetical protein [Pseudomonas putida]AGN82883.1 hypothetical protein L483_20645 [Pseudomonas putida H8234]HDS1815217.1 hypothetical protein [Pseudomonas putida]HDS3812337.1 hypothetical protein [Pseudomonas putida]